MKAIIALAFISMSGLSSAALINVDLLNCNHCKCGSSAEAGSDCDTKIGGKPAKKTPKKS